MSTPLQKQRQREAAEIEKAARKKGKLLPGPPRPDIDARLATIARYIEPILASNSRQIETYKYATLVDKMGENGLLWEDCDRAARWFRELYFLTVGKSEGVGSYGEYQQSSPPSQRMLTTDEKIKATRDFQKAFIAVFCVLDCEGRWVMDKQLMELLMPALLGDEKKITQNLIGLTRTRYRGRAQVNSAGGSVIMEALHRLSLHFRYRVE